MAYNSVPEMLDDMGEKEMADEIRLHENCHKEFALLIGKIAKLEEKIKELERDEDLFCADGDTIPMDIVDDSTDNNISIVAAYERKCERLESRIKELENGDGKQD